MRQSRVVAALFASAVLASCSLSHRYASTAAKTESYPFEWAPIAKNDGDDLTADERVRSRSDLDGCVRTLATIREYELKPTREERLIELVRCMKLKGWHIVRYSIVVT
jgi:hypothetical protein